MSAYSFDRLQPSQGGIQELANLMRDSFPGANRYTEEYLHWQYNENPEGTAIGFNASVEGALAAHYVVLPIRAYIDGVLEEGVHSLNTATHPKHRGKGLFTKLAEKTYEAAALEGKTFVVGVANANSTPGFIRKLGFQLVCPLDAFVAVGKPVYQAEENPGQLERYWTDESVAWRTKMPGADYEICRLGESGGLRAATGSFKLSALIGCDPRLTKKFQTKKSFPVNLWLGRSKRMHFRGVQLPIPHRLRPSPLNLIFKDLTGEGRKLRSDDVEFQAWDFDAY